MHKIFAALAIAVMAVGPAFATEQTDAMMSVHQFIDGFNKGDVKTALAACAEQTSIIDDFPPHEWHGPGACAAWANDFGADAQKKGITDEFVSLGKPRHVDVTTDRADVVAPATYAYKRKGKPVQETGATLTLALQKVAAGWRITGWAWAKK